MSWLSLYHAILDYHAKIVIVAMLGMGYIEREGDYSPSPMRLISFIHANRLIGKAVWPS